MDTDFEELKRIIASKRVSQGICPITGKHFNETEKHVMSRAVQIDWRKLPEGKEKYNAYLASREWAVLKEQVRNRSGGKCERCLWAAADQVHHQTYERKYREVLTDLLHVCRPCHEFVSGKREDDPILARPLLIRRGIKELVPVQKIYLAGKIRNTRWRDEIAETWSDENHSIGGYADSISGEWQTAYGCISTLDTRKLDLTGPWWWDMEGELQHRDSTCNPYPHAMFEANENPVAFCPVWNNCERAIYECDLLFAWIDCLTCFGTLVEIGYAYGTSKPIAIYTKSGINADELWLSRKCSYMLGSAPSAGAAWKQFLKDHTK